MTRADVLALVESKTDEERSLFALRAFATEKVEDGHPVYVVGLTSNGAGEGDCWYTGLTWEEALARMFDKCDICERPLATGGPDCHIVKHGVRWEHLDCLAAVVQEERMLREETT